MPTADEFETLVEAARDAALDISAAGATTGAVTATSTRQYIVSKYSGGDAQARLIRDLKRNLPPIHNASVHVGRADGVVLVAESDDDVLCVVRCKKA